ncbi:dnaJsubfamily C member 21 [Dorcoceras hygrometricum]|uniref:DnaJsubfamily C member 21 n=1 Tax=Dorcoceras hygrometricum TaxID=472368 RepID=A0A2Z7AWX1_9LAMI|nr:dnaJsubfamily C member 21 [Dorcoceras hygrometricum]
MPSQSPRDPSTEQCATNPIHATEIENCQRTFATKLGILPGDYARREREPPRGSMLSSGISPEDSDPTYQARRSAFHLPAPRRTTWYLTNRARPPDVVVALG